MTPLMLQVLMHSHTTCSWEGMNSLRSGNETWIEQTQILINAKMIEPYNVHRPEDFPYRTTEKGKFWIKHILNVPFPEPKQVWEIPHE